MIQLNHIYQGDALDVLREFPDGCIDCCVTSPPYYRLRDYGVEGQIGLEPSPAEYVARLTAVFEQVRRVLKPEGTLWLNLGDSYASGGRTEYVADPKLPQRGEAHRNRRTDTNGMKPKDLLGIPWLVAFALRDAGWYLRQDIIWHKPNPMPESVTDRPARAHEYVFLLSKSPRYYYDADAIRRAHGGGVKILRALAPREDKQRGHDRSHVGFSKRWDSMTKEEQQQNGANARSVWSIATKPFSGAHFAVFPPELPEKCILAGCPPGGVVLDPFLGSGTTGMIADRLGRNWVGVELNPKYITLARNRIGLFQEAANMKQGLVLFPLIIGLGFYEVASHVIELFTQGVK